MYKCNVSYSSLKWDSTCIIIVENNYLNEFNRYLSAYYVLCIVISTGDESMKFFISTGKLRLKH